MNGVKNLIDDLMLLGYSTFENHLKDLDEVLTQLGDHGLQVNPLKRYWVESKVEYLG